MSGYDLDPVLTLDPELRQRMCRVFVEIYDLFLDSCVLYSAMALFAEQLQWRRSSVFLTMT